MLLNRETLFCRYAYDPLDRLVDCTPSAQATAQRFYLKDRLATEIQGEVQLSIMQHNDQLLAQKQRHGSTTAQTSLLAADQQRSVFNVLNTIRPNPFAYTPYGHRPEQIGLLSLLGFNGERPDSVTGWYLLGNGYRAFNPMLMRFNSPDSWSPFGVGGLNAYAYCLGDPINRSDPTGHLGNPFKGLLNLLGRTPRRERVNRAYEATIQNPLSTSASRAEGATPGAPPPYSEAPPQRPFNGMSQQELDVSPTAYPLSETNLVPSNHSLSRNPLPMQSRSSSTLNREPPPSYFEHAPPRPNQTSRQAQYQHQLNNRLDHRQRILATIGNIPPEQLGRSINETLVSLNKDIARFRSLL